MFRKNNRGFTLVEIMLVVAIIALLTPTLLLSATVARQRAQAAACLDTRRTIEGAEQQFRIEMGQFSTSLYQLVHDGYLNWNMRTPAGGIYAWVPYPPDDPGYHTILGCSIHGAP